MWNVMTNKEDNKNINEFMIYFLISKQLL